VRKQLSRGDAGEENQEYCYEGEAVREHLTSGNAMKENPKYCNGDEAVL